MSEVVEVLQNIHSSTYLLNDGKPLSVYFRIFTPVKYQLQF